MNAERTTPEKYMRKAAKAAVDAGQHHDDFVKQFRVPIREAASQAFKEAVRKDWNRRVDAINREIREGRRA